MELTGVTPTSIPFSTPFESLLASVSPPQVSPWPSQRPTITLCLPPSYPSLSPSLAFPSLLFQALTTRSLSLLLRSGHMSQSQSSGVFTIQPIKWHAIIPLPRLLSHLSLSLCVSVSVSFCL